MQTLRRTRRAGLDPSQLEAAARALLACFRAGGKVLIFGNGGSAADAQHMAAEFVCRVRLERPTLPAIALTTDASVLTAIANDFGFEHVFSRQVSALGRPGDLAIVISTSGASTNVLAGADAAHVAGMRVVGITSSSDAPLARLSDIAVTVVASNTQQIQEAHLLAEHVLCEAVERRLFGDHAEHSDAMDIANNVIELADLLELRAGWRAAARTVVWTNGIFDLLHAGHVHSLEGAKGFGDVLIVGVNIDATVQALKGDGRPIVPEHERAQIVGALQAVDYVTLFHEPDPSDVLRQLQPDVHCKGTDYAGRPMSERAVVEAYGGRVEFIPRLPGLSTTKLIRTARAQQSPVMHDGD